MTRPNALDFLRKKIIRVKLSYMKIERICLFLPPFGQYGITEHFTRKWAEALERSGIEVLLLKADRENPKPFLDALFKNPPDCTLSFNGLLPDEEGRFFCDLIQIPHVACLIDSPNHFFSLTQSKFTIITCADRYYCDFFRGFNVKNVFFLPHGVEKELHVDPASPRDIDVLMLSSCIDYEEVRCRWKELYHPDLCQALDQAIEITLLDPDTSYIQAIVEAMDNIIGHGSDVDPRKINFELLLDELETYIRGKDRVELVQSLNEVNIHIYGGKEGSNGWEKYIGKEHSHITLHDAVSYEEAVKLMQRSKVVLNSTPTIKNGTHERVLAGISSGALVLTSESTYMREKFDEDENILFYQHRTIGLANQKILPFLADEEKRVAFVKKGQKIVQEHHTWDARVKPFLKELEAMLHSLQAQVQK